MSAQTLFYFAAALDVTVVFTDEYQADLADPTSDAYAAMVARANAALEQLLNGDGRVDSITWYVTNIHLPN